MCHREHFHQMTRCKNGQTDEMKCVMGHAVERSCYNLIVLLVVASLSC